jgi:uncharacterized membrane protein
MSRVLKWWLVFCISLVIGYLAYFFGWVDEIYSKDTTKLSFAILAIYVAASLHVGHATFKKSKKHSVRSAANVGWFLSETMLTLGMIGTVAGFILMLGSSFENIDTSNAESLKEALTAMALGMSTALYTTLVGLICSQILKIQLVNLETGD